MLELVEKILCAVEQDGDLGVDVVDGTLLLLIGLEDLEELLVGVGILREALLDLVDVVDGMVELDGRAFGVLDGCHGSRWAAVTAGARSTGWGAARSHGHG